MPIENRDQKVRNAAKTASQDVLDRCLEVEELGEAELKEVRGGAFVTPAAQCW